jgi:Fur family transcriptional regulator, iron response regulator
MRTDVLERLRERGIQPSAQRLAVAQYVLFTDEHPSADRVWARVRNRFPMISRATVYNTLSLFAGHGLVRELHLSRDSVVFDANIDPHHHFIDGHTGRIYDIPWEKASMRKFPAVDGFEIRDYQVVMRGRRDPGRKHFSPTQRAEERRPHASKQGRPGEMTSSRRTRQQKKKSREENDRRAG